MVHDDRENRRTRQLSTHDEYNRPTRQEVAHDDIENRLSRTSASYNHEYNRPVRQELVYDGRENRLLRSSTGNNEYNRPTHNTLDSVYDQRNNRLPCQSTADDGYNLPTRKEFVRNDRENRPLRPSMASDCEYNCRTPQQLIFDGAENRLTRQSTTRDKYYRPKCLELVHDNRDHRPSCPSKAHDKYNRPTRQELVHDNTSTAHDEYNRPTRQEVVLNDRENRPSRLSIVSDCEHDCWTPQQVMSDDENPLTYDAMCNDENYRNTHQSVDHDIKNGRSTRKSMTKISIKNDNKHNLTARQLMLDDNNRPTRQQLVLNDRENRPSRLSIASDCEFNCWTPQQIMSDEENPLTYDAMSNDENYQNTHQSVDHDIKNGRSTRKSMTKISIKNDNKHNLTARQLMRNDNSNQLQPAAIKSPSTKESFYGESLESHEIQKTLVHSCCHKNKLSNKSSKSTPTRYKTQDYVERFNSYDECSSHDVELENINLVERAYKNIQTNNKKNHFNKISQKNESYDDSKILEHRHNYSDYSRTCYLKTRASEGDSPKYRSPTANGDSPSLVPPELRCSARRNNDDSLALSASFASSTTPSSRCEVGAVLAELDCNNDESYCTSNNSTSNYGHMRVHRSLDIEGITESNVSQTESGEFNISTKGNARIPPQLNFTQKNVKVVNVTHDFEKVQDNLTLAMTKLCKKDQALNTAIESLLMDVDKELMIHENRVDMSMKSSFPIIDEASAEECLHEIDKILSDC
eukprot:GHVL01007962.1.p1 GENE.GHVL01007962.1~~GHVL01007962.1.p1  ORF type:complete len:748 (+),score=130.15 GHVL01007962.1:959-3202(+)